LKEANYKNEFAYYSVKYNSKVKQKRFLSNPT